MEIRTSVSLSMNYRAAAENLGPLYQIKKCVSCSLLGHLAQGSIESLKYSIFVVYACVFVCVAEGGNEFHLYFSHNEGFYLFFVMLPFVLACMRVTGAVYQPHNWIATAILYYSKLKDSMHTYHLFIHHSSFS